MVRVYIERADVGKKGSVHLLRHAVATHMIENGADIRYVQALLGHLKLETTALYTHVAIRKLKEVHSATHPAEAKSKTPAKVGSPEKPRSCGSSGLEIVGPGANGEAISRT